MNPFWIGGTLLFVWALILAFALGLRSEGFPRDDGQMKAVIGMFQAHNYMVALTVFDCIVQRFLKNQVNVFSGVEVHAR